MKVTFLSIALLLAGSLAIPAYPQNTGQSAKQDMKDEGHDVKNGAEKTGHAAKKGATKSTHAVKRGVHKAATKVSDKTTDTNPK
ncbi:MAG: hypothetical protein JO097_07465 [Acidobacteriaceae bacterium]|nr:hypothetical protein [Acidobacteriaceae bacterium]MBV9296702.1 hypothetical protein [Acidobacteriaceae bacterium]MBV9764947.1 hypothetical protein [Acidobacteriaceae bacterium]